MNIFDINLTPKTQGKSSFSHTSRQSPHATNEQLPLPEFIRNHELTDALEYLEAKGLCGEHALFALVLTQNLMCRGVEL